MKIIELTAQNFSEYGREIAELHLNSYSKQHLTANFSVEKLEEYYRYLVEASELSIVSLDYSGNSNKPVLGFIVAGRTISRGVVQFLDSHRLYVLSVMLKNPVFIFEKIFSKLTAKFQKGNPSDAKFRLLSIAVKSDIQSHGIGHQMVEFFENTLIYRGISCYGLSVKSENIRAIKFYEKYGFVLEKEISGSKYFRKDLNTP